MEIFFRKNSVFWDASNWPRNDMSRHVKKKKKRFIILSATNCYFGQSVGLGRGHKFNSENAVLLINTIL